MHAVVTGHSRGLGAAIAHELLARGVHVLGIARKPNPGLTTHFPALQEAQLDLTDDELLALWVESGELQAFLAKADVALLVNNAGLLQPVGPLAAQDITSITRAVAVNVGAALALSAAFVQATEDVPGRRIMHISSGAARHAYAGWSVYCATKAALDHHARAVTLDHTPRLRICSVAPGVIDTDMQGEVRASDRSTFPDLQRFLDMKREGNLKTPAVAGKQAVDFLLSAEFGREPLHELPR